MDAAEFERRTEEVRAAIAATLAPDEVARAMEPLETFAAIMRENEREDAAPPPGPAGPYRYEGSSEDGQASVDVWRGAGDDISIWVEEEYRKEGQPLRCVDALCWLTRDRAAALGQRLIALAAQDAAPPGPAGPLRLGELRDIWHRTRSAWANNAAGYQDWRDFFRAEVREITLRREVERLRREVAAGGAVLAAARSYGERRAEHRAAFRAARDRLFVFDGGEEGGQPYELARAACVASGQSEIAALHDLHRTIADWLAGEDAKDGGDADAE
jgi:hypothetical protein